jgi:predicted secreted protein
MKSLIRVVVLTLALISAGHASAVFAADAWEIVTPASTSGYSFATISAMDDYVYLGTNHGVYRSINRGTSWTQINSGLGDQNVRAITIGVIFDGSNYAINSATPVFTATAGGVFKSTIGSTAWTSANVGLTDTNVKDIQFDQFLATQGIDTTVYAATPAGVFRSDDAGDNWLLVDTGMTGLSVTKIMTDFLTGNIYALTTGDEIYVSPMFSFSGGDESWTLAYSGSSIYDLSLLNPLGGVYWLATNSGILKSDENGTNLSTKNSGNASGRINVIKSDYWEMNVTYAGSQTGGVYRTLDEALSNPAWAQISTSLSDTAISDIATNPATSLVVYATGANGVYRLELSDAYADISTTPVVATDTTLPTVSISAPANNATISNTVSVTANASDNVAVVGVQFKLDGANLGAEDTSAPYSTSWNTASSTNGAHTLTAVARDAAGNTKTAATINVTVNNVVVVPDTTLPTLSAFTMPTTATSTIVAVSTLTASDNIGVTGYLITESATKPASGAAGWSATKPTTFTFAGTGARTAYAWAKDAAGNVSNVYTVRNVTITLPDTTSPTINLSAPSNNATVSGNTTISATASDNIGVAGVQFKLDGANLGAEDTTSPFSISWNTSAASNGNHTLTAVARDAAGNTATASTVSVTVNNVVVVPDTTAPSVTAFVMPANPLTLSVSVSTFTASDAVGVTGYLINESSTKPAAGVTGWTATAPTSYTFASAGAKTVYAWAKDAAGNVSNSLSQNLIITLPDTTIPTVSISAPANNATISNTVSVTANASDNVAVVGVQFKLDGANLGAEDTSAPYSTSWNTASSTNGAHTLTAIARDAAGNTQTATTVNVNVNNVVVVVPDTTAPSIPTNFSASVVSAGQINLVWTASTDAVGVTGYRVLRRNGSGSYSTIGTTAMTNYTDTTVSPLSTYTYRVAAYDAASNTSGNATSLTVTTLPTAPTGLSAAAVSTSQVNVAWTASSEAISSYELYRNGSLVGTITHPTVSYSDTGLAASTNYSYTLKSVTASGTKSVLSNSVSATTQANVSSGGGSSSGGGGGGGGSSSTRGCTDPKATNYSAKAKKDNGTCKYTVVKSPTAGSSVVVNNPSSISGYTFTTVMGLGSKGTDVTELQKIMVSLGYLNEAPTGYYGALTEQAVKRFQTAKGLEAVGSVGPQTRAYLNQITNKGTAVKTNDQIIQEKITQLLILVQELTKKLMILKAAEGR